MAQSREKMDMSVGSDTFSVVELKKSIKKGEVDERIP